MFLYKSLSNNDKSKHQPDVFSSFANYSDAAAKHSLSFIPATGEEYSMLYFVPAAGTSILLVPVSMSHTHTPVSW